MTSTTAIDDKGARRSFRAAQFRIVLEGMMLSALGMTAIILPHFAAFAVTIFLGAIFLFSGIVGLLATYAARHLPGFWWSLFSALVALAAGVFLVTDPSKGAVSVTTIVSLFFILDGLASIMFALEHRRQSTAHWAWTLASGLITLLFAFFILAGIPATTAILGLLVGFDMLFAGLALVGIGASLRAEQP
jgi:uncharacterized membrane protein HdeD (DUF308 family)